MSEQENIQIARRLIDELNNHQIDAGVRYFDEQIQTTATGAPGRMNKAQTTTYIQSFLNAFPDLHFEIQNLIAQGIYVAVTWQGKGRHAAPLKFFTGFTIPTTNRSIDIPGCTVYEFENDKIVDQKIFWDTATMLIQLGLVNDLAQITQQIH